jgi:hypothetical protein
MVNLTSRPVSAKLGDKEVLQAGFDLDSTQPGFLRIALGKMASISGTIVDAQGKPVAGAMLAFLSDGPGGRGSAVTNETGTFRTVLAMAGDYHVYMLSDQNDGASLTDVEYLQAHQRDFPVLRVVGGDNPPMTLVWAGK